MKPDKIFPFFFAFWAALGLSFFAMFHLNKNVEFKKKYFPPAMIFSGVVFVGFLTLVSPPGRFLFVAYPFAALIVFLNIRMTKFCSKCGATNYNRMLFTAMNYCQKCGAPLKDSNGSANKAL